MRMMGEHRRPRIPSGYWRVGHCGHLPMPPRRMMLQAVRKFIYVGVARDSQAVRPLPVGAIFRTRSSYCGNARGCAAVRPGTETIGISMLELKSVGILLRDADQSFPLEFLKSVLKRVGGTMHLINQSLPADKLDLIIAMGGDGTVLKALDMNPECPVLAINYGSVGFLTAGDRTQLADLVSRLLDDDYLVSERILLHCEYPGGSATVINEVVLRSSWRMINVDVSVDGAKIRTIRGDGVIVGTPTGSTGYLLSVGGPIVMPDAQCFVLDGINEYNFTSRALILPASAEIHLRLATLLPEQEAYVYIDGSQASQVAAGAEIHLSRSPRRAKLIFFERDYFFRNLSSRLSWY